MRRMTLLLLVIGWDIDVEYADGKREESIKVQNECVVFSTLKLKRS